VTAGPGDPRQIEGLLRELAPQALGALVRRYGTFDACEDAVQEALLAAAAQWPRDGVPANPRGWLVTVAGRRLTDELRSRGARRRREESDAVAAGPAALVVPGPGDGPGGGAGPGDLVVEGDDSLALLFLCCHPALSPPSQVALTLRAVGGLTTAEVARAFLVPEATVGQRISRAKATIVDAGATFELPRPAEREARVAVVLQVLYLVFNEGYATTSGDDLLRVDLTAEAVRLTRQAHRLLPEDPEVAGLLALMLLTDARRPARTRADGALVPLDEQDRSLWDAELIAEGVALVTRTLPIGPVGPYQVQAAIAAVHDEAPTAADTDWAQVLALYGVLERIAPNPLVTLNRAVALAEVDGPQAGLDLLATLDGDRRMARNHRLLAVRAHLLERAGELVDALAAYRAAARLTTSRPEQRHLETRAARLAAAQRPGGPRLN
jgi:RNA polymerase sigma factor (sigma-70 family)